MSTPFPIEEEAQQDPLDGRADPWSGPVRQPFGAEVLRSPYTVLEAFGSGAAKGQAVLAGALHTPLSPDVAEMTSAGLSDEQIASARKQADEMQRKGADAFLADARERVKALTPDPATTGTATQMLHGLAEGAYLLTSGALAGGPAAAAATVGSVEGGSRYQELKEQGVGSGTAATSGAITAITSAAGAFMPAAYGSTLATRLLTGAASNAAFGTVNRTADHLILQAGGYDAMADQQKVWDGTQMVVDAALGATFGGIHHALTPAERVAAKAVQSPEARDAALAVNLVLKDRQAAPGVAIDPEAANAHQAALEKAQTDLLQGKPVDVSDTGIAEAAFARRPTPDLTEVESTFMDALRESGFLQEQTTLEDLETQFTQRRQQSVKPDSSQEERGYTLREEPLTDEQLETFKGLRSEVPADQELEPVVERESRQSGTQDVGGSGREDGSPLRAFRGASRTLEPGDFGLASLGHATGHPSSGLGVFFSLSKDEAARYGSVTEHNLDIRNPKVVKAEDLPGFESVAEANAYRESLREQGYDGMVIDGSHLGGPVNYVAFDAHQVIPTAEHTPKGDVTEQALATRPGMMIPDEQGGVIPADEALAQTGSEDDWFKATKAATDCFSRRGG